MITSQMAGGGAVIALREREEEEKIRAGGSGSNEDSTRYYITRCVNDANGTHCDGNSSRLLNERFSEDIEAGILPDRNLTRKASVRATDVQDSMLRLNIGGSSYRIRTRSIVKYGPTTLLGRFVRMNHDHRRQWADWYFEDADEYFFERVPRYFDPIYDFYATGRLHVPKDLCFDKFMAELRFWAVSKSKMDDCCSPFAQYCALPKTANDFSENETEKPDLCGQVERAPKIGQRRRYSSASSFDSEFGEHYDPSAEKDRFIGLRCAKLRRRLWLVLEGHTTSKWWKAFEMTSTSFVVLSIMALILGSIPEFQVPEPNKEPTTQSPPVQPTYLQADDKTDSSKTVVPNPVVVKPEMVEHPIFNYVENICVVYFVLEYILRFVVSPQKWRFVKEFLNIIDLLAILPFLFEIVLIFVGMSGENVRKVRWAFLTVRLLRVLRIVRIAKLGRFSPGLANFALTLRKSKKQMQMVAIVMLTVVVFFSTLVYFLEKDEPKTTFTSIPASFWWAVVTMSTVGYGDSVPQTIAGKLVGSGAIVCGVMVLALPITIMVNNFMQVVKLREEKIIKKYAQQHGDQV